MRRALLHFIPFLGTAFGSCAPSGGGSSEPLPILPGGLLRDPSDWSLLPRAGRDVGCEPGTPCARAFDNLFAWASRWDDPEIHPDVTESIDNNNDHDVVTLACALAWRASDDPLWRDRAGRMIEEVVEAPYLAGVSALKPGRNLLSYVLAASTIELADLDGPLDLFFREWIERLAEVDLWVGDGVNAPGTFRDYQEERPNNVGLVVGASRMAVDMYLGGDVHARHLLDAKRVFLGFLGDDRAYNYPVDAFGGGFADDNSWQCEIDPRRYEGLAPVGARIPPGTGLDVDGCLPEEMRRLNALDCAACALNPSIVCYNAADWCDGGFPPGISATGYPWEALQGLVMQAYLLWRAGFDSFAWQDAAIERAHRFLFVTYGLRAQDTWNDPSQSDDPACCDGVSDRTQVDDTWVPHILEAIRDASFLDETNLVYGGRPGKNCGFADWWTLGLAVDRPSEASVASPAGDR